MGVDPSFSQQQQQQEPRMNTIRGRAANICIWFVSALFFLLLIAGGVLLALYMVFPENKTTMWFPAAGMFLVGVPWAFWIMTCFYRFMAWRRPPGEAPPSPVKVAPAPAAGSNKPAVDSPPSAKKAHFAAGGDGEEKVDRGAADGGGSLAVAIEEKAAGEGKSSLSHESEVPQALSKAMA